MSASMTDEDKAFIRAILNNPAELTGWLAYADWLDERDDPRAEFIRLEMKRLDPNITQAERFGVIAELEDIRMTLDEDWMAIFDRPAIENCDELFAFKCPKQWEKLHGTDNPYVRDCDACQKQVYYCLTLREAYNHAQ
ncbi:MAG: TIGR02996 domain-containing protein, partial [Planctomycetes bacterium]|nr:TIGR02996 domain-containing protein [Planctomycetota bacterium]